ncbi:arylsulfatase [Pedobacter metabolipauper]|uniref:Arylsulfatase n=1 Tax=Pedobacter metabolipauper TaxID=425513 RepID=A0A4R6SR79_9SPHI|nr:arylsulfatase [Pedobacter metabolipauper]TDQ07500.1 arylsulfatase [Pedobacter metabolipauper]
MKFEIKRLIGFSIAAGILLAGYSFRSANAVNTKPVLEKAPNILIIMADDMGYSDIGCYGSEIATPNLDQLAASGIRFRQFYNGARCCPTRASLLTGLYPHQAGIGHMTNDPEDSTAYQYNLPGYQGSLNNKCVTIAEVLKTRGYQTMMSGKWHVGYHDRQKWPLQRGFDKYYGILAGAANYFNPTGLRGLTLMNEPVKPKGKDFYLTDALTDHAIDFLNENHQQTKAPFFMYLAYTSPHWPLNALQDDVKKYRGKYKNGWKALRKERYNRMIKMGILKPEAELSADDAADWDKLSPEKQDEMDFRMALYAAQIDRMDQNIGRVVKALTASGELDNTLILFLSDNGACAEGGDLGGGLTENLGTKKGYMLSYGQSWANVSNTPFKKYKHWVNEGGISTPLIAYWPKMIPKASQGKFSDQYGFLPDIMATVVAASGAKYPLAYKGQSIIPMEGKSILPILQGKELPVHHQPIFWEHEGNSAVRMGNLKLVCEYHEGRPKKWELYDLDKDRSELHDLSASMPEQVSKLSKAYNEWASRAGVVPFDEIKKIQASRHK